MSEFHSSRLREPASVADDDVTSLVGHVVGVFSPHLVALCDAYSTYLAGLDNAGDTLRRLMKTNPIFADYVDVSLMLMLLL